MIGRRAGVAADLADNDVIADEQPGTMVPTAIWNASTSQSWRLAPPGAERKTSARPRAAGQASVVRPGQRGVQPSAASRGRSAARRDPKRAGSAAAPTARKSWSPAARAGGDPAHGQAPPPDEKKKPGARAEEPRRSAEGGRRRRFASPGFRGLSRVVPSPARQSARRTGWAARSSSPTPLDARL